jgi:hypothetical protein
VTEIELFDSFNDKIHLMPSSLEVRNLGSGPKYSIEKMINNNKLTNDEK